VQQVDHLRVAGKHLRAKAPDAARLCETKDVKGGVSAPAGSATPPLTLAAKFVTLRFCSLRIVGTPGTDLAVSDAMSDYTHYFDATLSDEFRRPLLEAREALLRIVSSTDEEMADLEPIGPGDSPDHAAAGSASLVSRLAGCLHCQAGSEAVP
jgi:hypothetical protein